MVKIPEIKGKIATTNRNMVQEVKEKKFREDLYYRLNQVPINMPPLRKRAGDIHLLFRKFTTDFSEMHRMPPLSLSPDAVDILESYPWPGNIRQLKHITEQMSVLEAERKIDSDTILSYLPETHRSRLPVRITTGRDGFEKGETGAKGDKGDTGAKGDDAFNAAALGVSIINSENEISFTPKKFSSYIFDELNLKINLGYRSSIFFIIC